MKLHAGGIRLCGVLRFGGSLAVPGVPRAGAPCRVCLPGLRGRPEVAGRWAAVCPWRRRSARGGFPAVPSDGMTDGAGGQPPVTVAASGAVTVCVPRPAARSLRAPQRRLLAASSRQQPGRPVQGRRQGGGVQPPRLAATARQRRLYRERQRAGRDDARKRRALKR